MMVLVAFAECFWSISASRGKKDKFGEGFHTIDRDDDGDDVVANPHTGDSAPEFNSFRRTCVTLFIWAFGNFDVSAFDYMPKFTRQWCMFLASLFMVFVSVILFNLLIAYMADVFVSLNEKGMAEWGLMQAKTIDELYSIAIDKAFQNIEISNSATTAHKSSVISNMFSSAFKAISPVGSVVEGTSKDARQTSSKDYDQTFPKLIHFIVRSKDIVAEKELFGATGDDEDNDSTTNKEISDAHKFRNLSELQSDSITAQFGDMVERNRSHMDMVNTRLEQSYVELQDLYNLERDGRKKALASSIATINSNSNIPNISDSTSNSNSNSNEKD